MARQHIRILRGQLIWHKSTSQIKAYENTTNLCWYFSASLVVLECREKENQGLQAKTTLNYFKYSSLLYSRARWIISCFICWQRGCYFFISWDRAETFCLLKSKWEFTKTGNRIFKYTKPLTLKSFFTQSYIL